MLEPAVFAQLYQVRGDAFGGGGPQRIGESLVHPIDDLVRCARAGVDGGENLLLARLAVREVFVNERGGIVDDGAVAGEEPTRSQGADAAQGRKVVAQAAAGARGNHDGAAVPRQIAAEEIASGLVEEAQVVGRVTRCRNGSQDAVARGDGRAIRDCLVTAGYREIGVADDRRGRPPRQQRWNPVSHDRRDRG